MIIPTEQLSDEALDGLIDEYCTREHGLNETESPLAERKAHIRRLVERGEMVVLYTPHNPNQVAGLVHREALDREKSS